MFRNQKFYQVWISSVCKAQIQVRHDRYRYEQIRSQLQRCKQHHRSVCASYDRNCRRRTRIKSHQNSDRISQYRTCLRKQRDRHTYKRMLQNISNVTQDTDTHKYKTCDQSVAECKCIKRLQKIDLQEFHQFICFRKQRIYDKITDLIVFQKQHTRIYSRHTKTHWHHDKWLQRAFHPKVCEQKSYKDQYDPCDNNGGRLLKHRTDTLEKNPKYSIDIPS